LTGDMVKSVLRVRERAVQVANDYHVKNFKPALNPELC
jgi:hypothetical protein